MFDIANPELKIAIEVDGETHSSPKGRDRDNRKEGLLKEYGWKILRFKNEEILNDLIGCMQQVYREL